MRAPAAYAVTGLLCLILASCGSSVGTTKRDNLAYLYGKGSSSIQLSARVHHSGSDRSTLYFKLATRDLLYKSDGAGGLYRASVQITYESFADWNSRTLLDSASVTVQDRSDTPTEDKELIGSMELRGTTQRATVMRVTAKDLHRENQTTTVIRLDRPDEGIRQYFLPVDLRNGLPLFDDHLQAGTTVKVRSERFAGSQLWGGHYRMDGSLPSPVFTTGSTARAPSGAPDSSFIVAFDPEDATFVLHLTGAGIYHLRPDTASDQGYTLFVMGDAYPFVGSAPDLLKPLRYITSMQEYDRIAAAPHVRGAIERFWMDAAGERERAREAIRIYYARVENANRHFTTHVEGWRTDRGLVHIIFGTPTSIYRSETSETWIFGEENNLMSLNFTFVKRKGPFSDNDLVLQRDPLLKGAWYRNVESWRNGRVYQN